MATDKPSISEIPLPESAVLLALLYQRLGGSFSIASNGERYIGRPNATLFRLQGREIPQLADAEPHEQFHCPQEWTGAIKVIEALLSRLSASDTDVIFDLFARIAVDQSKLVPSIEEPRRAQ